MKKLWQLIRVLIKCGKVGKGEQQSSSVGDMTTLIYMGLGVAAAVGVFFGGQYAAEHQALLGGPETFFHAILILGGMVSFFLTIMTAVNQLYIASDLDVLVTLPFTPMQIVFAKLVSVAILPASICFGTIVPCAIGYSLKASGLSALFLPALVLGALLMTLYVVATSSILLMILMRLFRFIRSRNLISIITTLMVFALSMAYFSFTSNQNTMDEQQVVSIFQTLAGMAINLGVAFPFTGFVMKALGGSLPDLFYAIAIVAGVVVVLMLCAKFLYFSAALGMTDANGTRGPVKESTMKKMTTRISPAKALARREIKQILSTPALITNGYLYSIIVPFILVVPMGLKALDSVKELMAAQNIPFTLETFRQIVQGFEFPPSLVLMCCSLFGMFMACMAVAFSTLSRFLISREGKDFFVLKTMPIPARLLVRVKRNVVLGFNGISGFLLPAILLLAAGILQFFPLWVSAVSILAVFAWLLLCMNICVSFDLKKPNLNWENEADVMKTNYIGLVEYLIAFIALVASGFLIAHLVQISNDLVTNIVCASYVAVPVIGAIVSEILIRRMADRLY